MTLRRVVGGALASALLVAASALHGTAQGQDSEPLLMNPFGDPFVQATSGRPCPTPLGPAYTEAARRAESHGRIERGTSCWLAGTCAEPNAYRYDAEDARAAVAALRADSALASSAIWVTGQRRFLYLEGCVADTAQAVLAEAVARAVPNVEQVIPALALPGEKVPYAVAGSASLPR